MYPDQQQYNDGQDGHQRNGSSPGTYQGTNSKLDNKSGRQLQQPVSNQPKQPQRRQQSRPQKSWGSDIDLGALDDWDST